MKTLFFCNLIPDKRGAYEALLVALGREFRAAGDELVLVFARDPVPAVAAEFRAAGLRWELIEGWSSGAGREHAWAFCRPALGLVRRERPDVAVVNFGNELPTLAVALATPRTRWVWVQHQQMQDPSPLARHVSRIRLLSFAVAHFIAVYEGGRESLRKRGISAKRVSFVDNAIQDFMPTRPAGWLAQELGLARDTPLVVTTGWLIPRKRIDFGLRAFARVVGDAVLLVIGEGPERAELERLAGELGVAGRVRFLGRRNDVREILPECAVLMHTSLAETCTYAITEAMAASVPAVVTEAGAAREQIADGESGFVLAREDVDGLAGRLSLLLNDAAMRARFGAAARARFLARYTLENSARRYHELYRAVAGR